MSNDAAAVVGVLGMFSILGLVAGLSVWLVSRHRRERNRARFDLQRRMLEKFGSAGEFTAFIQTEGGHDFLNSLSDEPRTQASRIFSSIQKGAICALVGVVGFGIVAWEPRDLMPLAIPSGVLLAIGLGYLVSAWATYRLSRKWDLLPPSTS